MISSLLTPFEGFTAIESTVAVLVISVVAAGGMEFVILRIARRYVANTETEYDNIVIASLRAPLVITAALVGVYVLIPVPAVRSSSLPSPQLLDDLLGRPPLSVTLCPRWQPRVVAGHER